MHKHFKGCRFCISVSRGTASEKETSHLCFGEVKSSLEKAPAEDRSCAVCLQTGAFAISA